MPGRGEGHALEPEEVVQGRVFVTTETLFPARKSG